MSYALLQGDCLEQLKNLPDNSVDSLVTDPPAGIGFMGKHWDGDRGGRDAWVAWMRDVMRECLRVMKPGAHGLVWSLPRTSHWTATALEDAGFEIRDCVYHIFGSGFPKSLDVSKAIDKAAGAEREVLPDPQAARRNKAPRAMAPGEAPRAAVARVTAPATDAAKQWQGWGTALKPAVECWWLIRKPCSEKTVAANVLKWGTGALNIDASRIEGVAQSFGNGTARSGGILGKSTERGAWTPTAQGRFPSHLILDEEAGAMLDEQGGTLKTGTHTGKRAGVGYQGGAGTEVGTFVRPANEGGASRFFYCAKISASERNSAGPNGHPTVKPQKLMRYLIRMVTPPNGLVLDPFTGSGSTGVAALSEGFDFLGVEKDPEYVTIADARLEAATTSVDADCKKETA